MNKWKKIGLAAGMGTAVIATTHIIKNLYSSLQPKIIIHSQIC